MESTPPAIESDRLHCGYENVVLLKDLSFSVTSGEVFFIIGQNGCGKSTLLRHLVGLQEPFSGTIRYFGANFTDCEPSGRLELLKRFGVLFQNDALWSSMDLSQNLALPMEEHTNITPGMRAKMVSFKLEQVGLKGYETYFPRELSGGMRKRAALARAIALDPEIIFLDEPTVGLDPVTARRINELILRIREQLGTTIVIVSHILSHIFALADRLIFLDRKQQGVIAEGAPRQVANSNDDPRITEFFHQQLPSK